FSCSIFLRRLDFFSLRPVSQSDLVPESRQGCLADALHLQQVLRRGEGAVGLPVVDDPLGQGRADAVEGVQLLQGGGVHVHQGRGLRRHRLLRLAGGGDGVVRPLRRLAHVDVQRRQGRQEQNPQQQQN